MKIGFLLPWDQDIEKWTLYADAKGIDGIEVLYSSKEFPVPYNFNPAETYEFRPAEINKAFENKRVKVCGTSMFHVNTIAKDPEERDNARRLNTELIKTAAAIGSPLAMISTGCYEEGNIDKNIAEFRKEYEYIAELGDSLNVKIAYLIGHKPTLVDSFDNLKALCEYFPEIKFKIDPVGVIRNLKADPYEVIRFLGSKIAHLHFKDILRMSDYEIEPPVGMGELKWNYIMAMLYNVGFDDFVVIEPHGPMWGKMEKYPGYIKISQRHIEQFII